MKKKATPFRTKVVISRVIIIEKEFVIDVTARQLRTPYDDVGDDQIQEYAERKAKRLAKQDNITGWTFKRVGDIFTSVFPLNW